MVETSAHVEVRNPLTTPERLAELVHQHPELHGLIAAHPQAYPELIAWIAEYGQSEARPYAQQWLAYRTVATAPGDAAETVVDASPTGDFVPTAAPAQEPAEPVIRSGEPPSAAPSPRARIVSWGVAGALLLVALLIAIPVVTSGLLGDRVGGTLADGANWGQSLGAELQRNNDVWSSGTGLGSHLVAEPDRGTAYVGSWNGFYRVDTNDIARVDTVPVPLEWGADAVAASADGTRLFLSGGPGGDSMGELVAVTMDGDTAIVDYQVPLPGLGNMGEQTALSPDGSLLYIADMNTGFWIVDATSGQAIANPLGFSTVVVVNPVSGVIAVDDSLNDVLYVIDPGTFRELFRVPTIGLVDAVEFSPDGELLAVGVNGTVEIYDRTGSLVSAVPVPAQIADLAFSPASAEIAVLTSWSEEDWGSAEREGIRLIDVASAQELTTIPLTDSYIIGNLAFTGAPGELLALSSSGLVRVDVSASRTGWTGVMILLLGLALVVAVAVVAASTVGRWQPVLARSQERSRQERERQRAAAAERTVALQSAQAAAASTAAEERAAADHAERVRQIEQWQAAYREAHGGQEPPAGFLPLGMVPTPATSAPARTGTNILAVLALIFGIGGGLLGIIFGHIALSQIRRTGESGRGMAIAGLILGYIGLGLIVLWLVIAAVLLSAGGMLW